MASQFETHRRRLREPTTTTAPPALSVHAAPHDRATRATVWDRLAVVLIGAAGFALSFDALQQMAVAIHVRGPLTYVFPFTLDGFIAYGVRALLVLRAAPLAARAYAWLLFAGATAASVWANALHAVRLNHLLDHSGGLSLGDTVVGVLSTLSPLALGGAVHLYILIARHTATPWSATGPSGGASADHAASTSVQPDSPSGPDQTSALPHADRGPSVRSASGSSGSPSADRGRSAIVEPDGPDASAFGAVSVGVAERRYGDTGAGPNLDGSAELPVAGSRTDDRLPEPGGQGLADGGGPARRTGRPPGASMERLLEVSRPAVQAHGRPSRAVVERAVREADLPLGSTRFTVLMDELRKEFPDDLVRHHPPVD
ncbi:DUF2637 domain-containing protein [Kitasatospora sp. NPDC058032]|uniref:DUF2637 domain-containing protein n=1 Tax=Kitasatospora sp. NPDC058032 TaxID=3346307 RepID=UPI0036DDFB67